MASTRQGVSIRDRRGSASSKTSSEGARSSSSTTSCSGPTTRQGVRPARRSRTGSTAPLFTWRIMTSRLRRCRGRRSRSCRRTSGGLGWDVPVGVVVRQRLQLRLQRRGYRGAAARGECRIQLPARRPPCCLVAPPRRVRQGLSGCGSRYATAAPGLPLCPRRDGSTPTYVRDRAIEWVWSRSRPVTSVETANRPPSLGAGVGLRHVRDQLWIRRRSRRGAADLRRLRRGRRQVPRHRRCLSARGFDPHWITIRHKI